MIKILPLITLSLSLLTSSAMAAEKAETEANNSGANPSFKTFDGKSKKISDYTGKGKWTIVMIWAHDCPDCNAEAKSYVDLHNRRSKKDIQVLGLSVDGKKKKRLAEDFIKRHKVTFPNLIGEFNEVASMFENISGDYMAGTPSILIYNTKGEAVVAQIGRVPASTLEQFVDGEKSAAEE